MLKNVHGARMGFANKLVVLCKKCNWEFDFYTSTTVSKPEKGESEGRGRDYYEENIRASVAFREIGKGRQGMENFSRIMNMNGLSSTAYSKIKEDMCNAYSKVADESMTRAGNEVTQDCKD